MARENNQTNHQPKNAPDYLAWHVAQKGENGYWTKIGAAWQHKDGQGYTLHLETYPIDGRIVLRTPLEPSSDAETTARA